MSTINKINYEQFAMDYLEGNLSGELLKEMNAFLEKNPAIKKELDGMELFYLEADESIVFEGKEALLKPVPTRKIFFLRPIFMIASCLLICASVSVFFLMNNENVLENEIAVENEIIINDKDSEEKIIEKANDERPSVYEKTIEKELESNDVLEKSKPAIPPGVPLKDKQPIANQKEKNIPVYYEKPMLEAVDDVPPIIAREFTNNQPVEENQPVANNEEPLKTPNVIRETVIVASLDLEPIDDSFSQDMHLQSTLVVVDEAMIIEKQSRLVKLGLLPEREGKRKISFKTIKEALIPEGLAFKE